MRFSVTTGAKRRRRFPSFAHSAAAMAVLMLTACQTTGLPNLVGKTTTDDDTAPVSVSYSLFFTPADHLKELMAEDAADLSPALGLVDREWAYFAGTKSRVKYATLLDNLARRVNARHRPVLEDATEALNAVQWPAPASNWPSVKITLDRAQTAIDSYPGGRLMGAPGRRLPLADQLSTRLAELIGQIRGDAPAQFAAFAKHQDGGFFAAYPLALDGDALWSLGHPKLIDHLSKQSSAGLLRLARSYDRRTLGDGLWQEMGRQYADRAMDHLPARLGGELQRTLALAAARNAGFSPTDGPNLRIAFVEATSQTLLRTGEIDFSAEIDLDLPVDTAKMTLDEALSVKGAEAPDLIVVFQVALAKASRRVVELKQVPSTLFIGFSRFGATTTGNVAAQPTTESSVTPDVVPPEAIDHNRNVIGQPKALGDPIMVQYNYDKAKVVVRKNMTVKYFVIDRQRGRTVSSLFDAHELNRFEVGYRIHRNDPRRARLIRKYDSEKDVDDFEKAGITVRLSQLLTDYSRKIGEETALVGADRLRREILADRNTALLKVKANTFDARPLNDPRFDSVVAVYRGKGSMGTGFYVMPNVVLTNWHVIEDSRYVEMKLYDGRETFGTVLGRDARLDLALVRVEHRGKPVRFRTDTKIDAGATVEAIGHPHRHEFSITRGVVSAIRNHYSINLPKRAGDKVLYVQTDAPIHGGNSGGPLFLGDYVIGVNTWGRRDSATLSFAVHYSEVLAYLKEHLPGFQVLN